MNSPINLIKALYTNIHSKRLELDKYELKKNKGKYLLH